MTTAKKKILVVVDTRVHMAETQKFIRHFDEDYDITIFASTPAAIQTLDENAVASSQRVTVAHVGGMGYLKRASLCALLRGAKLFPRLFSQLRFCVSLLLRIRSCSKSFKRILKESKPDILLLHEGNFIHLGEMYINIAHKKGVPSLVLPYTICTHVEPAEALLSGDYKTLCSSYAFPAWVKRKFPQWVCSYKSFDLIRLPLSNLLAMEMLKIAAPLPWVQESCSADVILVENERNHQHYLEQGIPEAQQRVVGNVNHDIFHTLLANKESERRRVNAQHGFAEDMPIIAVSVQPDCFDMRPEKADYSSFDEALAHWCEQVQRIEGYNIILVPHPSIGTEVYQCENDRIKVAKANTAHILPLADLYIASISATIKWAIACGIPVINYDYYRFHYDDYDNAPGVFNCYEKQVFEDKIAEIAADPQGYIAMHSEQMAPSAKEWGDMDGKFRKRFDAIVNELLDEAHKPLERGSDAGYKAA